MTLIPAQLPERGTVTLPHGQDVGEVVAGAAARGWRLLLAEQAAEGVTLTFERCLADDTGRHWP